MGYDIVRRSEESEEIGHDAYADIRSMVGSKLPVIFDVGANVGQTIDALRKVFPSPIIHAFEPGKAAFDFLLQTHSKLPYVRLNNLALGSKPGQQIFFEHSKSYHSSFLPLGPDPRPDGWGPISDQREIEVSTVDRYCMQHEIQFIDLLKSDTQGFDLEVLKGAQGLLNARKIRLIYLEIIFQKLYEGIPRLDEIYRFISDHGFELVSFYKCYYLNGRAGRTDALFIQPPVSNQPRELNAREAVDVCTGRCRIGICLLPAWRRH
jgi:FkbM family methyltransferase